MAPNKQGPFHVIGKSTQHIMLFLLLHYAVNYIPGSDKPLFPQHSFP